MESGGLKLLRLLSKSDRKIKALYDKLIDKLARIGVKYEDADEDGLFAFSDNPQLQKKANELVKKYANKLEEIIKDSIVQSVNLSFLETSIVLNNKSIYDKKAIEEVRRNATEGFLNGRKRSEYGLGLSDRVWNYSQQAKSEFEAAMSDILSDGISKGISAEELARKVKVKLRDPDAVLRRYHLKKVTKKGKRDVIEWRKRVVDDKGKVHFVKTEVEHTGRGVCRSSRKNALRLTATEINMAYDYASCMRYREEPFVKGIRISLSGNHTLNGKPFKDICDILSGDYPKTFLFRGWHPRCRCIMTSIIIDKEEEEKILFSLPPEKRAKYVSPTAVKELPPQFTEWMEQNADRLDQATERGTLPYFVRDNQHLINPQTAPTPLEIAQKRHTERTPEKEQMLREFWAKKQAEGDARRKRETILKKRANTVLEIAQKGDYASVGIDITDLQNAVTNGDIKLISELTKQSVSQMQAVKKPIIKDAKETIKIASDFGEVDATALKTAISARQITLIKQETKALSSVITATMSQENALKDLIPNVHDWHKQFTMAQLQDTHAAVKTKIEEWQAEAEIKFSTEKDKLQYLQKKLNFEAVDYLGGNMHDVQNKYQTWKVSQEAFLKEMQKVMDQIDWIDIKDVYAAKFKTNSAVHNKLVAELNQAIKSGNLVDAIYIKNQIVLKRAELAKAASRRANKKAVAATSFNTDDYTQDAKDKAIWCKLASQSHTNWDADSEAVWNDASKGERKAWRAYTEGSGHMNRPLRGYDSYWGWSNYKGVGKIPLDAEGGEQHIRDLYSLCERHPMQTNRWLQRGIETWAGVEGFFGKQGLTRAELRTMVGKQVTDYAFASCGSAKGTGFSGLILNIYCPRGTKGFYACPHSYFGDGENETILQAGTIFRVTKVEAPDEGTCYVDIEVIGYVVHPLL